jgi:protein-disulfide isomerase/uncharacterized membrane protein
MKRSQLQLLALAFVTSLGLMDALYLTNLKLQAEVTGATRSQLCEAISDSGCEIALSSDMSAIGPVPISLVGTITYALIIALVFRILFNPKRRFEGAAIHLIALGAVLGSAGLAWYSWAHDSWCVLCIGLYGVNLAIYALISFHDKRGWIRGIGASIRTVLGARGALVVTLLVFGGVLTASQMAYSKLVLTQTGTLSARAQELLVSARTHGTVVVPISTAPHLGPDKAKTLIVKFSDFQCPYCKQFWHSIEQLHKLRDDVQIAFRHYPLSSECNPFMGSPFHEQACRAAYAAVCADRHGKFWEMGSALYANQPDFSELSLLRMASQIGLEPGPFKMCLHDPTVRQQVIHDVIVGRSVGISGTPGCIIDGFRFEGALPEKMLAELIDTIADPKTNQAAPNAMITNIEAKMRTPQASVDVGVHRLTHQAGTLPAVVAFVDPDRTQAAPLLRTVVALARRTAGMFPISIRLMSKTSLSRTIACALQHDEGPTMLSHWLTKEIPTEEAFTAAVTQLGANAKECMSAAETEHVLTEDQAAASALGIQGSAALFVGNVPMNPAWSPAQIEQAVALLATQTHQTSTTKDSPPE